MKIEINHQMDFLFLGDLINRDKGEAIVCYGLGGEGFGKTGKREIYIISHYENSCYKNLRMFYWNVSKKNFFFKKKGIEKLYRFVYEEIFCEEEMEVFLNMIRLESLRLRKVDLEKENENPTFA